ncbi:hypothetical protein ACFRA5_36360 [Streptomyces mirabilis]|uniref:GP88 family protein n=1 Tax=Streptomyces mirabilis TaxID=68239 RepID=UPI0036B8359C
MLDPSRDRVADVYPDEAAIRADGWHSQDSSDLLAVLGPAPVGTPLQQHPAVPATHERADVPGLAGRAGRPPHWSGTALGRQGPEPPVDWQPQFPIQVGHPSSRVNVTATSTGRE